MRAAVIFDTRYGNTAEVARSLESGLKEAGAETRCASVKDVAVDSLGRFDLICVGGPTEWLTASGPMKSFLDGLGTAGLPGKFGFAFDTNLKRTLSGSAAKFIEKKLRDLGLVVIAERESAKVRLPNGNVGSADLEEGESERFREVGFKVGAALAARTGVPAIQKR